MLTVLVVLLFAAMFGVAALVLRSVRNRSAHPLRVVRIARKYKFESYEHYQANYMFTPTKELMPNTVVKLGRRVMLRVNSLGFKGREIVPHKPLVAVFGDSLVQGVGVTSFPEKMRISGFQVLNCGIEGANLEMAAQRFEAAKKRVQISAVLLHAGWHNLLYGANSDEHWISQFDRFDAPVVAHMRLVTDSNEETIERGYDKLYRRDYPEYVEVHSLLRRKVGRERIRDMIAHFNEVQERYCAERGRVVIDLDDLLAPKTYDEVTSRFFDMCHPRPQIYAEMAAEISRQLAPHLRTLEDRAHALPAGSRPRATQSVSGPQVLPFDWSADIRKQARERRSSSR